MSSFLSRILPGGRSAPSPKDERQIRQDAVEKLCNSLLYAALLEDRRAAAQALKSVSKHYQFEIGSIGMPALTAALKRDSEDVELTRSIVETFLALCSSTGGESHVEFCEMLLKEASVIHLMLSCLKDRNQYVRYDILQLLGVLEEYLPAHLPTTILSSPSGLVSLLDLLDDDREIIQNEAVLLLQKLTESNPEIQKIAVFEGIFERLFDISLSEGGVFADQVIVQDSMVIVQNLLRHSPSNQNYFCESSCIHQLSLLLKRERPLSEDQKPRPQLQPQLQQLTPLMVTSNDEWKNQMIHNFCSIMEIICILLHRDKPKLFEIQNCLYKSGIFDPLVTQALSKAPNVVKASAMTSLASIMFGNEIIQNIFARHLIISSNPQDLNNHHPIPAVLSVIRTAVDGDDTNLRLAATNMIGSYLKDNPEGQLIIAATFKSPNLTGSPAIYEQSAGSIIIGRALDITGVHRDRYRVWFPTIILSHVIFNNDQCKLIALNHQDKTDKEKSKEKEEGGEEREEEDTTTLFTNFLTSMNESIKDPRQLYSSVAYLILLSTWMYNFPLAVANFLSEGSNVQLLIELINQNSIVDPMIQGCAAFLLGLTILYYPSSHHQVVAGGGPFTKYLLVIALNFCFRKALEDIIRNRIGIDVYFARMVRTRDKLNSLLAIARSVEHEEGELFDTAFAQLFLETVEHIQKLFYNGGGGGGNSGKASRPFNTIPRGIEKSVETIMTGEESKLGNNDHTLRFEIESLRIQLEEAQVELAQRDATAALQKVPVNNESPLLPSTRENSSSQEKNFESKCAYLTSENVRLQKTIDAYTFQMLRIEKDHEELLMILASYDNELKQLRQHLTLAEQKAQQQQLDHVISSNDQSEFDLATTTFETLPSTITIQPVNDISNVPNGALLCNNNYKENEKEGEGDRDMEFKYSLSHQKGGTAKSDKEIELVSDPEPSRPGNVTFPSPKERFGKIIRASDSSLPSTATHDV